MRRLVRYTCAAALGFGLAVAAAGGAQAQQKVLKMQATWPAS